MSLEQALAENTAAIRELIAALSTNPVAAPVPEETRKPETVADAEPEKKKPEAKMEAEKEKSPEPAPEKAPEQPTYQETAAAITKLSRAKGRDAALAVLAEVGAAKLPEVSPDQFGRIMGLVEAALEA